MGGVAGDLQRDEGSEFELFLGRLVLDTVACAGVDHFLEVGDVFGMSGFGCAWHDEIVLMVINVRRRKGIPGEG